MSTAMATYSDKLNKTLHQKGLVGPVFNCSPVIFTKSNSQIGDIFKTLEDNTGVQRLYIGYGLIGLMVTWLAFGFGAQLLANIIG